MFPTFCLGIYFTEFSRDHGNYRILNSGHQDSTLGFRKIQDWLGHSWGWDLHGVGLLWLFWEKGILERGSVATSFLRRPGSWGESWSLHILSQALGALTTPCLGASDTALGGQLSKAGSWSCGVKATERPCPPPQRLSNSSALQWTAILGN